jgi:hypothetical protein
VLLLPNQIPATAWSHLCRVHSVSWNIAAFPDTVRARRAVLRQRHFAVEDDVRCLNGVRVVRVEGVRSVLPYVRAQKSFRVKLPFQRFLIGGHFLHPLKQDKPYACFSLGRNIPAVIRATVRRGTIRTVSAPSQFLNPEITEVFPAASAASPT